MDKERWYQVGLVVLALVTLWVIPYNIGANRQHKKDSSLMFRDQTIAEFIQDAADARTKGHWSREDIAALRTLIQGRAVIAGWKCERGDGRNMICSPQPPGTPFLVTDDVFVAPGTTQTIH